MTQELKKPKYAMPEDEMYEWICENDWETYTTLYHEEYYGKSSFEKDDEDVIIELIQEAIDDGKYNDRIIFEG